MICQLIDNHLQSEQDKRKDRERSGLQSPSLFGRCYRLQYYNRKGEEPTPFDARTLRIFKVGHMFHKFVQNIISHQTPDARIEVEVTTDSIHGFADIVTTDTVYDLKSQHSKAFWYLEKGNKPIEEQKYPNILQLMTYVKYLKKKKGVLVLISKDDLCIAEYAFHIDQWEKRVEEEIKRNNDFFKSDTPPPAEPRAFGGRECKYCSFEKLCKEV